MKKKRAATTLPLAEFRTRFLRVLKSYYAADPLIARILKDQALQEHCAALFWLTENDARARIAVQSARRREFLAGALDDAITGTRAIEFVYLKLDGKPHLAEYMSTLRGDLVLKRQALDTAIVSPKAYGRDRDWSAVRYAKMELEARLKMPLPSAVIADLLNAADKAAGRRMAGKKTEVFEADVTMALRRLQKSAFDRILPFYRQLLAEHYPLGSDLDPANKTPRK